MESFREHKDVYLDSDTGEQFVNKVVVDRYIKNNLNNIDNNNNVKIYGNEKDPKIKINRRTTSLQKSIISSFLMKNKAKMSNPMTSFREIENTGYQKMVSTLYARVINK